MQKRSGRRPREEQQDAEAEPETMSVCVNEQRQAPQPQPDEQQAEISDPCLHGSSELSRRALPRTNNATSGDQNEKLNCESTEQGHIQEL